MRDSARTPGRCERRPSAAQGGVSGHRQLHIAWWAVKFHLMLDASYPVDDARGGPAGRSCGLALAAAPRAGSGRAVWVARVRGPNGKSSKAGRRSSVSARSLRAITAKPHASCGAGRGEWASSLCFCSRLPGTWCSSQACSREVAARTFPRLLVPEAGLTQQVYEAATGCTQTPFPDAVPRRRSQTPFPDAVPRPFPKSVALIDHLRALSGRGGQRSEVSALVG
jgi:hypothetical protein